ncbi:MAG: FMN-binding protein [Clostridia bacterium]|nr:FMN-binding protein [Clostridia bacterium]
MKKQMPAWMVLGIIALIAGCALGFTNELTSPIIQEQTLVAADEARRAVLPDAAEFEELAVSDPAIDSCYLGSANGAAVGHTVQVTVKGYGGDIELVVGVDNDGVITGLNVGGANFSETAGLGAKSKEPAFTEQFKGLTSPLVLKDNVDSITGASITSGAVVNGVNAALDYVAANK